MKLNLGRDLYIHGRIGWRGLSKDEYLEHSDYRIINATALMDGYVDWNNCGFISKERYEESFEIMLKEGDILISKDGTLGKIGYVKNIPGPCSVASGIFVVRNTIPEELNFDYLYHILKSPIFKDFIRRNKALGSTIPHLYQRDLEEFELELPSLEDQTKIADVLNSIDNKIRLNDKMIENLRATARTIYEQWFLQCNVGLKTDMCVSKELGRKIPSNWCISKLEDITELFLGGTPSTKNNAYWGGNISWLNSGEVANFPVVESELAITKEGMDNSATKLLPAKTTVVSITGNIRCSITAIETCANQSVVGVVETAKWHTSYLYQVISDLINKYVKISTGNCQQHINKKAIEESYILLPPENIMRRYYSVADPMFDRILNIGLETKELIKLRNKLLPLLMNGQVSVQ